ncbi:sigma factor-like helix-turn-helix DNA-binding protein [Streptomyces sp. NPDC006335]|uniref:sigma factor-like helix-turn-helix DNA-binding protein n=1 Tax=Streptomyces sp. NPDC006335 TaxID=3156895 RepID=UPI0033A852B9
MNGTELLAERFQEHRGHLRAVAYRMLGSLGEAEEAVEETWLELSRSDPGEIPDPGGRLVISVGRVCLDRLRARAARRADPSADAHVPDPVITPLSPADPEQEVLYADAVGLALLVALEELDPAERLAFVLHDMFAVPFDDIAPIVERPPAAARQLAGRARRRVREAAPAAEPDLDRQREVLGAFLAAARAGDVEALVAVLHPDVVLRADSGAPASKVHGARAVAEQALQFRQFADCARLALVNGEVGIVNLPEGRPLAVAGVTVTEGRIAALHVLADPARLARLDLPGTAH